MFIGYVRMASTQEALHPLLHGVVLPGKGGVCEHREVDDFSLIPKQELWEAQNNVDFPWNDYCFRIWDPSLCVQRITGGDCLKDDDIDST